MARSISSATARMDNQAAREMMRISVHGNKIPECRVYAARSADHTGHCRITHITGELSHLAQSAPRNWPAPVDRVFIEPPGAPPHISAERVIFGAESIAQPVIVTLCKGEICVHIAGSGDGRYRVRS